jgi:hypothetical protein
MLSFFSVEDVIILHGVNILILSVEEVFHDSAVIIFKHWMLSFLSVEDVINFLGLIVIILKVLDVLIFHCQQMLSFSVFIFLVLIYYHILYVIICVIIFLVLICY